MCHTYVSAIWNSKCLAVYDTFYTINQSSLSSSSAAATCPYQCQWYIIIIIIIIINIIVIKNNNIISTTNIFVWVHASLNIIISDKIRWLLCQYTGVQWDTEWLGPKIWAEYLYRKTLENKTLYNLLFWQCVAYHTKLTNLHD